MKGSGTAGRAKAAIIEMHLGDQAVPGQPPRLLGGSEGLAYRDLVGTRTHHKFHPVTTARPCPTCNAISRFFRVPNLDGAGVGTIVDQFLFSAKKRWTEE